jgi:hypothetical protein
VLQLAIKNAMNWASLDSNKRWHKRFERDLIDISAGTIGGLNGPELIVKENLDYCISGASRTN